MLHDVVITVFWPVLPSIEDCIMQNQLPTMVRFRILFWSTLQPLLSWAFLILLFFNWPYLCSEGDSGCDRGGCWFDAPLQRAQRAPWVPFPTRTAGSVQQTSWWCPGRAGPSAPVTRSSWCRCHCCKTKKKKNRISEFAIKLQGNDKTNENKKQSVALISFHKLLQCLGVDTYSFGCCFYSYNSTWLCSSHQIITLSNHWLHDLQCQQLANIFNV